MAGLHPPSWCGGPTGMTTLLPGVSRLGGPFRVRLAFKVGCTALLPASGCSSTCCRGAVSEPPLMAVVEVKVKVKVRGLQTFPVKVPMTPSVGFEA